MIKSLELALLAAFIGAMFLVGAAVLGILNFEVCWAPNPAGWSHSRLVSCDTAGSLSKQVGFGAAINWSIGLVFLFPLFIYCACETANQGQNAIEAFVRHRMIVTRKWVPVSRADIMKLLRRRRLLLIVASLLVALISTSIVPFDYKVVVGDFYERPEQVVEFPLTDYEREADWSIAAPICKQLEGPTGRCVRPMGNYVYNAVFAALAYGYLAYFGSIVSIVFVIALGLFATFFISPDFVRSGYRLVPDVDSPDSRKGFQLLEGFFLHAVAGCFVLFAMGYLVVLQNVYLRTAYGSIAHLIVPFLASAPTGDDVVGAIQRAVSEQLGVMNLNSVAVTGAGFLIVFVMVVSAWLALRATAKRGVNAVNEALDGTEDDRKRVTEHLGGLTPDAARAAINDIEYWPLKWPTLNALICWLVLAVISLFFVTVGFYIMSVGLAYVVQHSVLRPKPADH